jgi:hypothetical protein
MKKLYEWMVETDDLLFKGPPVPPMHVKTLKALREAAEH